IDKLLQEGSDVSKINAGKIEFMKANPPIEHNETVYEPNKDDTPDPEDIPRISLKLKKEVLKLLRTKIPTAFWEGKPTHDAKKNVTWYHYNYKHDKDTCINGSDKHTKKGGYLVVNGNCS